MDISEHVEIPLSASSVTEFKLKPPPKGKAKSSMTLPSMALNPIYAGPVYESPGGESFKSLLGGTSSVPSTPLSCDSPRYFDMPPSLPPPRRFSKQQQEVSVIPEEKAEELAVAGAEEYTVMSPVLIPGSSNMPHPTTIPPPVYEVMNSGNNIISVNK